MEYFFQILFQSLLLNECCKGRDHVTVQLQLSINWPKKSYFSQLSTNSSIRLLRA